MIPRSPIPQLLLFLIAVFLVLPRLARAEGRITLEQAYDRALATDQTIRTAFLEVRKANLLPWSALTRIAPVVTAGPGYSIFRSNSANFDPLLSDRTLVSRRGSTTLDLSFTQTLIDLSVFPAYRLGKLTAKSAHLAQQYTIRGTLFGVTTAYYEVLKQQRLVDVNKETLALAQGQLDLAEKRYDVGEVTRSDVLRARVAVESDRQIWIQATNGLELDRNTLRNILNFAPSAPLEVVEPPAYPRNLPPFETLLREARQSREDLQEKRIAVQQDLERKNEVLARYAPKVSASASGGYNNTTGTARSRQNSWQVGVGVDVPIFTGGQREIDLITAKYQIEQTQLDLEKTEKTVEADVKQAWLDVRTLEGTLTANKLQLAAAEQAYKDLQARYSAGDATSVDVLLALNDLDVSRKELAVQTYQYEVSLRNLEQVTGVFQQQRVVHAKIR